MNIRHVRVEEFEDFMRYVERAFGHSKAFFEREYPHLYRPTEQALTWAYVVEEAGEIASHVGIYPIEAVTAGVRILVGGIGAVSTAPEARGKGYMTLLLNHVVNEMRRIGYPVSWLAGDRQRYNSFGWEMAGPEYRLQFSQRSLQWHSVDPVPIEEVLPEEALGAMQRYMHLPACHTIRPDLDQQIRKMNMRFWLAEDGYAILAGQGRDHIHIVELVSASHREAGMVKAILDWNFGDRASWRLSMWDVERLGRLMPVSCWWSAGNSAMYRINDLTQLLLAAHDTLNARAAVIRDFAVVMKVVEHDRTAATTLTVENGSVHIESGEHAPAIVELEAVKAARLVFGGPPIQTQATLPAGLLALMPVPVYVMPFDHV